MTVEATAKKKKDAKNLAFKLMAVKLGEILRLLKPQPGRQTMLLVRPEILYVAHCRHRADPVERADQGAAL